MWLQSATGTGKVSNSSAADVAAAVLMQQQQQQFVVCVDAPGVSARQSANGISHVSSSSSSSNSTPLRQEPPAPECECCQQRKQRHLQWQQLR
jgi:hypothetical protein